MKKHEYYMKKALIEAKKAELIDEVPVGAIVVYENKIIAKAHNLKENKQNPINHAEILAIQRACKKLKSWRLNNCTLYVTLEPCSMCAGAIIQSRISKVVYAATDMKTGAFGGLYNICDIKGFNSYPEVENGILAQEASKQLKNYFKNKRIK